MIEVKNLTKRYGEKLAVDNASFTVNAGEIVGFLGRNGAGKTTAMNMITGYISSTSGTAMVDGYDILKEPAEVKKPFLCPPRTQDIRLPSYPYTAEAVQADNQSVS